MEGLTTAATVLLAAGVGLACALERYLTAAGATALALLVLRVTKHFGALHDDAGD